MLGNFDPPDRATPRLEPALLVQLMASGFPDAICFKDTRRRFISLNKAECRNLGVGAPEDVIGQTADRFVAARRARMWRQEDTRVLVTGEMLVDCIENVVLDDGTIRWLSATKAPLRDGDGAICGLVAITRDVTIERLNQQLQNQFIAAMSHELRTPVAAIMGSLSLVLSGAAGEVPESAARLLRLASTNSQRLVRIINDILDLEKLSCGMMAFELQPVDIRAVVEQEIAATQTFADPFEVKIRLEENAADGTVRADPVRLGQVVNNLLSNAVKFSPRGAEVLVDIERLPAGVRITVRDRGPGIPLEYRNRVFDKFVQVAADARSKTRGTGLGLSIVKQIVSRLHGDVGCDSAPGGGSIFYVTLPICEQEVADRGRPCEKTARHQR